MILEIQFTNLILYKLMALYFLKKFRYFIQRFQHKIRNNLDCKL